MTSQVGGTQNAEQSQRARLVTSLGENSDLIEVSLETSSLLFFQQKHNLRLIRSIFPLKKVKNEMAEREHEENSELSEELEDEEDPQED